MKVGVLATMFSLLMIGFPVASMAGLSGDVDSDGVPDPSDNCLLVVNPAPDNCDTDGDGYGNFCDADFSQDFAILPGDFTGFWLPDFIAQADSGVGSDMNCDTSILPGDFTAFWLPQFNAQTLGPSGLGCAGQASCN